jgi:lipopolysaccharide export LptBFGC system permease protein LptF
VTRIGARLKTLALRLVRLACLDCPAANQGFRELVAPRPVTKSVSEMRLSELRASIPVHDATVAGRRYDGHMSREHHKRWALAFAPLVLSLLAVTVGAVRKRRDLVRLVGYAAVVAYYPLFWGLASRLWRDGGAGAFAEAWTPNIAILLLCAVIAMTHLQGKHLRVPAR